MLTAIPANVIKYVRSIWMSEMILAYLHLDEQSCLVNLGGYLSHYGLNQLIIGQPAVEQISFLEGVLPVTHTEVLEFVHLEGGSIAHIHIIPSAQGTWVLFFDATIEYQGQQQMQQQINELSLLTYQQIHMMQELEVARQRLAEEKLKLEEISELKNRFITVLYEKLRTPLAYLGGYNKLLNEAQQVNAHETTYLASVKNDTNQLLNLVNKILSRIKQEANQIEAHPTNCEVKQVVNDVYSLFSSVAQQKGLTFEIHWQTPIPTKLILDEIKLRQILINLITHAFSLTEKGFVRMTLGWQTETLEFTITGKGTLTPSETQHRIFMPFYHEEVGFNIGLTMSHHLVALMEGELKLHFSPKKGIKLSGFIKAPTPQLCQNIHLSHHAKILVADDNKIIHELIRVYLQEGGYRVVSAKNGEEAVHLALETQPDLVLMDMHMPIMDGYRAVQKLRSLQFSKPIIAISASTLISDQNAALEAGCNQYLTKPVYMKNLLETVALALDHPCPA